MENGYSLLIVDDEEWIRRGLLAKVAKSGLPFSVVRDAADAEAAWRIVDEILPDVIVCDIRMGAADGLELCERITRSFPEVRLVVVSGYDEFDYARRALKLGAVDYLLKPVEAYELYQALRTSIGHIESRRRLARSAANAELAERSLRFKELLESGGALGEEALCGFLGDYRSGESLLQALCVTTPSGKPGLRADDWRAMISGSPGWREGRDLIWYADRAGSTTIILCRDAERAGDAKVARLAETLLRAVEAASAGSCAIGIGAAGRSLERSIAEAARLAKHRVLLGRPGTIRAEDIDEWKGEYALHGDRLAVIREAVRLGDGARISQLLHDVRREIETCRASYRSACTAYRHLLLAAAEAEGADTPAPSAEAPDFAAFASLDEAFAGLDESFRRAAAARTQPAAGSHAGLIHGIREYIDAHIADQLSLKELAARCHMNPSYLSELFHETIGMTFQDYVMKTRIGQAKLLLATGGCRMSEVAERTGFSDHNYFSKCFRRLTGLSPSEFSSRERSVR